MRERGVFGEVRRGPGSPRSLCLVFGGPVVDRSMASHLTWLTRIAVVAAAMLAQAGALSGCGVVFLLWGASLDARSLAVLDYGGSILICVVAPAVAFASVRAVLENARLISWAFLVPVVGANCALAVMVEGQAAFGATWPRWVIPLAGIVLPAAGALAGTFMRKHAFTVGPIPENGRGVRIT